MAARSSPRCFLPDHPLVRQFADDFLAGFGAAINELLEGGEFAHFTLRNDVVFDARSDAIDCRMSCPQGRGPRRPMSAASAQPRVATPDPKSTRNEAEDENRRSIRRPVQC